MNFIVAVDNNWGIGKDNDLLYNIKADMQYFKQITMNKVVVMGEKTLFSLPNGRPLKNRTNIVMSFNDIDVEGAEVVHSKAELNEVLKNYNDEDVFIIGGAAIYLTMLSHCKYAYITQINASKEADKFIPDLNNLVNWKLKTKGQPQHEEGIEFCFDIYENTNIEPLV